MDRGKRYNDEAQCVIDRFPRQEKAAVQEKVQDPVNVRRSRALPHITFVSDRQIVD